jgi:hypothetical protein
MKTETVAEFLARGGVITKVATQAPTTKPDSIKPNNNGGIATIVSMEEADLYHGEARARKPKKAISKIDLSALPEALRKKYVDEVISASQEDEEDDEED